MANLMCPFEDKIVNKFLFFNNRDNAKCPYCGSLERHRLVQLFIKKLNLNFNNMLHFAPEQIMQTQFQKISKKYMCADLNPQRYQKLVDVKYMDATKIPYNDAFDCVFASHILEHIPKDRMAMSEIYKSLVKEGVFIALVPQKFTIKQTYENEKIVTDADRLKHFGQEDHVRWYGLDFTTRLKETGFYIKIYYVEGNEENVNNMYYDEKYMIVNKDEKNKYRINTSDIIYVCEKRA